MAAELWALAAWGAAGFAAGSIPCSFLAARWLAGKDVRREGSGNVGATNVFRVAGRRAGVAAAAGDVAKSLAPVAAAVFAGASPGAQAAAAGGVVLGHCYSPFLGFRGGKGVASSVSVSLVLCWPAAIAFGVVWLPVFFASGYVSLASILAAAALPAGAAVAGASPAVTRFFVALAVFVAWKHRANVARLLSGTESRMRGGGRRGERGARAESGGRGRGD